MGVIVISVAGSFRPNAERRLSAVERGHAAAVVEAIRWLQSDMLPKALAQDKALRDEGHAPSQGFGLDLERPPSVLVIDPTKPIIACEPIELLYGDAAQKGTVGVVCPGCRQGVIALPFLRIGETKKVGCPQCGYEMTYSGGTG